MLTPAQNKELGVLTTMLDRFFGTDGLYGHSAPSTTPKAFVATLQEEADLGTLSVVTDPRLGNKFPSNLQWATVTCPVLTGVAAGSVFGCKVATFETFYMVGTIKSAKATTYFGVIVEGSPVFECNPAADNLSKPEQLAAKEMGGGRTMRAGPRMRLTG